MSADGTWNLTMQTPMGERRSTLTLSTSGGTLTGKQEAEGNTTDIAEGTGAGGTRKPRSPGRLGKTARTIPPVPLGDVGIVGARPSATQGGRYRAERLRGRRACADNPD
jgi:hypothetical protein